MNCARQFGGVTMNNLRLLSCFRVSAKMRPYVLRLRLRGRDFDFGSNDVAANEFTACIDRMREILVRRSIPVVAADKAILMTLEAAVDHLLSQLRFDHLRHIDEQANRSLDRLISELRALGNALSRFPPASKGKLHKRVAVVFSRRPFDTELFIEVIETITDALRGLSPKRLADHARSIIVQPLPLTCKGVKGFPTEPRRPLVIDHWESITAAIRVEVEDLLQESGRPTSLVGWLTSLANTLDQKRPVRKRAPSDYRFISRVESILGPLKLKPTRQYDAHAERQVPSAFQRYCNAALAAFRDDSRISGRQISNLQKRKRPIALSKSPYRH
jgi:hypothetical protein